MPTKRVEVFKYILVPALGDDTDGSTLATALAVARLSAGHLACLHVRSDVQERGTIGRRGQHT
jgi:hypothetical protein